MWWPNLPIMPTSTIFLLGNLDQCSWAALSNIANFVSSSAIYPRESMTECRQGALHGGVAIARNSARGSITGHFDAELIATLPKSGRYICHNRRLRLPWTWIPPLWYLLTRSSFRCWTRLDWRCSLHGPLDQNFQFPLCHRRYRSRHNYVSEYGVRQFNPSMINLRAEICQSHRRPSLCRDLKGKLLVSNS